MFLWRNKKSQYFLVEKMYLTQSFTLDIKWLKCTKMGCTDSDIVIEC